MKNKAFVHLVCSAETKSLIINECVAEFKKYNPDFEFAQITNEMILRRIALYYLDEIKKPL